MMTNIVVFTRVLNNEIKLKVEPAIVALQQFIARSIYFKVIESSPIFSGYYASNWRIIPANFGNVKLVPPIKPKRSKRGQFVENIPVATEREIAKLDKLKPFSRVQIATAVPYAEVIEARFGVLQNAKVEGTQEGIARFKALKALKV